MAAGFSSFVAWRYLMARPRRASASILGFTALATWVALAGTLAGLLYPLAHPYLMGPPLPLEILLAGCAGLAAVPVAAAVGAVSAAVFSESRQVPPGAVHAAMVGTLLAAAAAGIYAGVIDAGGMEGLVADTPVPFWLLVLPGALALIAALAYVFFGTLRALGRIETAAGSRALSSIAWGLAILQLLPLAALGLRHQVVPALARTAPEILLAGALALGGIGLAAAAMGLYRAVTGRRGRGRGGRGLALAALVVLAGLIGWALVSAGVDAWQEAIAFGLRQAPMWMTMPATIAGALAALSLVLVAVRYFFTFFTTVSIGGVCIGSMALVIVLSVMSGFETDLRDKILGSNAHILVTKKEGPFTEYREVAESLSEVRDVEAHTPYLETEVVISARNNYANVIIKGIDPATVAEVTDLDENTDDPDALAKLWPLDEDGSVAGPPPDRRDDGSPATGAPEADGRETTDPAPEDMDVDLDEPFDFSAPAGEPGEASDAVDPAPGDLDVDLDEPMDFSGGADDGGEPHDPAPGDLDVRDEPRDVSGGAAGGEDEPSPEPSPVPGSGPDWDPLDPMPYLGEDDWERGRGRGGISDPLGGPLGGLDPAMIDDPRSIAPEVARLPGVLVGRELVKQVSMTEGDEVTVVSPLGQDSPVGPVPRTKRYRVAGEFFTGMYEYDLKYVYVTLPSLQDFLDLDDEVSGIEVRIRNPDRSGAMLSQIASAIGDDYAVTDWRELNRSLFSALKLEKIAMFLVLAIIILVASFSIVGNLVMVVIEKAKEIALLKTLGATDGGVMKVFVVQGFFIGLVGTALGVSLGLVVCALGIIYGLPLDPDVYYIDKLPIHIEAGSVVAVGVAGILISVIATLYPAYVAARLRPVEGLRYE